MVCLLVTMLVAPIPVGQNTPDVAPVVLELVASPDGKVRLTVQRAEVRQVPYTNVEVVNGKQVIKTGTKETTVNRNVSVLLSEVKNLQILTADGKEADKPAMLKKLEEGGMVVIISADGKKVAPKFLKLFRDDTIILISEELGKVHPTAATSPLRPVEHIRPMILPAPAPPPPPPPPPS